MATFQQSGQEYDAHRFSFFRRSWCFDDSGSRCQYSAFEAYVEQVLGPSLRSGQVVMDNVSVHKVALVQQLLEARCCHLFFLLAYSPD